nr:ATP-binding protein [Desulfobacteraceae bacterium]
SGKIQASAGSKFEAADDIYFDFLHDRVRQTVYSHITDGQKNKLHHHIGKRILENTDQADLPNKFFFIINHLNYGKSLFSTPKNRYELAHLNFLAGTKANKSGAHRQAQVFLLTGEELLSDDAWDANHALNFELKKHRMECEYLLQNFNEGENLFQILLDHATSDEDRAGICNRKMIMLAGLARHEDALNIGLAGLSLLGVSLPRNAGRLDILRSLIGTKFRFNRRDIDSLLKLPVIEDPRLLLTLKILTNLTFSAFLCQPYLAPYLGLKIFKLTLKYGNSFFSPFAYVIYGASLCGIFRDYNTGYKFGKLSLKANKKFGGAEMTAKLLLYFGTVINIWTNHMHQGIAHNRRGVKTALETGDINYTVYHIQSLLMFLTAGGKRLDEIAEECDRYYKFVERSKDSGALNYLISLKQFAKCLKGKTFHHCSLDDKHFKETLHIKNMERDDIKIILFRHYLIKLRLLYITGDHEGALKAAHRCKSLQQYHIGAIVIPEYYFYHALALTAKCQTSSILKQKKYLRKAKYFCNKLKKLSHTCPENFMDKYLLVAAEIAKIYKKDQQAMTFYHHAIISAHNNNFTQNHAIANEAAAKFYISKGFENLAKTFMDNAIKSYRKWGATTKVDQLSKDFENIIISDSVIPTIPGKQHIDFHSIVKSLQMISTEIVLENLLKNLMKIVLENSGARKAQLLTVKSEKMFLEVENNMDSSKTKRYKSTPAENRNELFHPILNYVKRTQKYFVSDDISKEIDFINNSYFKRFQPKSVLCLPVIRHSQLVGLLYLENDIATSAFTTERIVVLQLLASQAAISLENARLYENVIHNEKEIRKISAEREEESISYQAQLRSLSSELSLTEEHERRKIAIDLHDRIGHTLTDASIKMRLIKNKEHSPDFPAKFEKIHSLINRSIQEARSLSFELSPPILYDLGLEAALDWLAEQTQNQHDIEVKFIDDMTDKPMNEDRSILLFQASRELLFNIVKHSRATKAIVSISKEENNIRIEIKDNGIGFEASRQDSNFKNGGFGLFSIRERINHQGGRLEIKDEPGVGSRVTMISPLKSI